MIEIFAIVLFCRQVGRIVRAKNRRPFAWQALTVALWFGCEIAACFLYGFYAALSGETDEFQPVMYLIALIAAACGGAAAVLIARSLPTLPAPTPNEP